MTPSCSSISYFPSAQTRNSRNGPTATFPEDSIPAHAGKTPGMDTTSHCVSAHPRSRGENCPLGDDDGLPCGSSPLTRGKRLDLGAERRFQRLIPAHAGKTLTRSGRSGRLAAHPRSRGENKRSDHADPGPSGSSPLTRGKRWPRGWPAGRTRLIPAHARKTPGRRRRATPDTGLIPAHAGKT